MCFLPGASAQLAIGGLTTVLENFKLSSNKSHPKKVFPPPSLPRDFRPYHVSSSSPGVNSIATPPLRRVLDANVRGLMLGETPIMRSTGESRWSGLFLYKDWLRGLQSKQIPVFIFLEFFNFAKHLCRFPVSLKFVLYLCVM